jgi:branched-chain amino acid transport system permease protein
MTLPSFSIGDLSFSSYRLLLFAIGLALALGLWLALQFTRFGVKARATMLDPDMARALGTNTVIVYSVTFGLGAFLAGFSGGLFALTAPIGPTFGNNFTAIAFIVVVVAGTRNIVLGTLATVTLLGLLKTFFTSEFNILIGQVAMLLAAFLIIRLAPDGIITLLSSVGKTLRFRTRK